MSLKSKPLIIEGTFSVVDTSRNSVATEIKEIAPENTIDGKPKCWCIGRHGKEHQVGDPFCHFPGTYKVPKSEVIYIGPNYSNTPVTFDEDLIMACINRAIAKTPPDFVSMLEEGRVNQTQARRINNELRFMGYCISEEPF